MSTVSASSATDINTQPESQNAVASTDSAMTIAMVTLGASFGIDGDYLDENSKSLDATLKALDPETREKLEGAGITEAEAARAGLSFVNEDSYGKPLMDGEPLMDIGEYIRSHGLQFGFFHTFNKADASNPDHIDGYINKNEADSQNIGWLDLDKDLLMTRDEYLMSRIFDRVDSAISDPNYGYVTKDEIAATDIGILFVDPDKDGRMDRSEYELSLKFQSADYVNPDYLDGRISEEEAKSQNLGYVPSEDGLMSVSEYSDALALVAPDKINASTFFLGGFANLDGAFSVGTHGLFGARELFAAVEAEPAALTPEEKAAATTALKWMEAAAGTGPDADAAKTKLNISGFKYDDVTGQWLHAYYKPATTDGT